MPSFDSDNSSDEESYCISPSSDAGVWMTTSATDDERLYSRPLALSLHTIKSRGVTGCLTFDAADITLALRSYQVPAPSGGCQNSAFTFLTPFVVRDDEDVEHASEAIIRFDENPCEDIPEAFVPGIATGIETALIESSRFLGSMNEVNFTFVPLTPGKTITFNAIVTAKLKSGASLRPIPKTTLDFSFAMEREFRDLAKSLSDSDSDEGLFGLLTVSNEGCNDIKCGLHLRPLSQVCHTWPKSSDKDSTSPWSVGGNTRLSDVTTPSAESLVK